MRFLSLRLKDYRSFPEARLMFSPRLNILVGENGQGKTNVIEALFLATQGDSFRYGENDVLIRHGANEAFVDIQIERRELEHRLRVHLLRSRKSFSLNDKRITAPDLRRLFPVVLFSPESLSAIKEGADQRRALVDDFLVMHQPANAALIADYRRVLKARNRLLRDHLEAKSPKNITLDVLDSLNPRFLRLASDLTIARWQALREIENDFRQAMRYVSTNSDVDISVDMVVSGVSAREMSAKDIDAAIHQRAVELREAELSSGLSLVGPHKHEINFLYHQKDSRFFCSQGQQRAIILSFKMAQIVYHRKAHGFYPVLMLDDVLSELDAVKRKALITFLHEINTQVFLTTTDLALPDHFTLENSAVIRIQDGQIVR